MNIGEPEREFEIVPMTVPVPEVIPLAEPTPGGVPAEPALEPVPPPAGRRR